MSAQLAAVGLVLAVCTIAGSMIAGHWILGLLFGPEYAAQSAILLALAAAAGAGFIASLLGYAITAGRRFKEQMPLQIASVAGATLACAILIPRCGLLGAALAVSIGFLVQIAGELWVLRSLLREPRTSVFLESFKTPAFEESVTG